MLRGFGRATPTVLVSVLFVVGILIGTMWASSRMESATEASRTPTPTPDISPVTTPKPTPKRPGPEPINETVTPTPTPTVTEEPPQKSVEAVIEPASELDNETSISWTLNKDAPEKSFGAMAYYDGMLYAVSGGWDAVVYAYDGISWRALWDTGETWGLSAAIYGDRLYVGTSDEGRIFSYDGTTSDYGYGPNGWALAYDAPMERVSALAVYDGKLWAGGGTWPDDARIYVCDGAEWRLSWDLNPSPPEDFVLALQPYGGKLYAGTGNDEGYVFVNDGTSKDYGYGPNGWALAYDSPEARILSFAVYDDQLYAGGYGKGMIFAFDGSGWFESFDSPETGVWALEVYAGTLYAGCDGKVYEYDGTWDFSWASKQRHVNCFAVYEGQLYAGTGEEGRIFQSLMVPTLQRVTRGKLFEDAFDQSDNGDPDWTVVDGTWKVENQEYSQSDASSTHKIACAGDNWAQSPIIYRGKLNIKSGTGSYVAAGLLFRYVDSNNFYVVQLRKALNDIWVGRRKAGGWKQFQTFPYTLASDTWYDLVVYVENLADRHRFIIYINNEYLGTVEDTSKDFSSGRIGLNSFETHVHCDDISVYLDDKIKVSNLIRGQVVELYNSFDVLIDSESASDSYVEFDVPDQDMPFEGYFKVYDELGDFLFRYPSAEAVELWGGDSFAQDLRKED